MPIYQQMLASLDLNFDFERVDKQKLIDKSSSLTVLIKSVAQVSAPVIASFMYESLGY